MSYLSLWLVQSLSVKFAQKSLKMKSSLFMLVNIVVTMTCFFWAPGTCFILDIAKKKVSLHCHFIVCLQLANNLKISWLSPHCFLPFLPGMFWSRLEVKQMWTTFEIPWNGLSFPELIDLPSTVDQLWTEIPVSKQTARIQSRKNRKMTGHSLCLISD